MICRFPHASALTIPPRILPHTYRPTLPMSAEAPADVASESDERSERGEDLISSGEHVPDVRGIGPAHVGVDTGEVLRKARLVRGRTVR